MTLILKEENETKQFIKNSPLVDMYMIVKENKDTRRFFSWTLNIS